MVVKKVNLNILDKMKNKKITSSQRYLTANFYCDDYHKNKDKRPLYGSDKKILFIF
jgi:hypothetical protein